METRTAIVVLRDNNVLSYKLTSLTGLLGLLLLQVGRLCLSCKCSSKTKHYFNGAPTANPLDRSTAVAKWLPGLIGSRVPSLGLLAWPKKQQTKPCTRMLAKPQRRRQFDCLLAVFLVSTSCKRQTPSNSVSCAHC